MAIYRGTGSASTTSDQATIDEVTTQATNAANSATSAASSASSAASSASSASSSASTATSQASAASTSATQAASSASAASTSASNASTSETNAATSATTASSSATAATTARTAAEAAQVAAETAETNAETAQAAAETAATNSATSATASATSATNAANSATASANSATASAASATAAQTAQTNAETAETNAEAALDEFTDLYLGVKSSAPTLDNDGDALQTGALYYDSTAEQLYLWDGSAWQEAAFSTSGSVSSFNTRTGAVTLSSGDVTTALGYTPYNSTNPNSYVVQSDIDTSIANLVASAPATLDTLNELAAALGDDANFSTTVTNSLATKAPLANPTFTTGIGVTGTVTADGLTVDGATTISIASNTLKLQNPTNSGASQFEVQGELGGELTFGATGVYDDIASIKFQYNSTDPSFGRAGDLEFWGAGTGGTPTKAMAIGNNNNISFYEDTGTTPKLFWDASAERLGIGTTSPGSVLHTVGGNGVRFDGDGGASTARLQIQPGSSPSDGTIIVSTYIGSGPYGPIKFSTGGTEAMRIDSSGNLLVNTTSDIPYTNSAGSAADNAIAIRNDGLLGVSAYKTVSGAGSVAYLNRTGTDGTIAEFYKDGSTVGSIGAHFGDMYVGTGDTGMVAYDFGDAFYPYNPSTLSGRDAAIDLGISAQRFKDLYLSGKLTNNGTGGIQVDTSGNVGIGTSSGPSKLTVEGVANNQDSQIQIVGTGVASGYLGMDSDGLNIGTDTAGLVFKTGVTGGGSVAGTGTERMRIDSSGSLRLGTTGTLGITNRLTVAYTGGGTEYGMVMRPSADSTTPITFQNAAGATIGTITQSASGTTYNTTSDARLKTDIQPIADATDRLMQMNPVSHKWKADPEADAVVGFIAQEMQEIVPEAVSGDADSDEMMSMDYGRITPVLVAALQKATKEIQELKARVAELEAK